MANTQRKPDSLSARLLGVIQYANQLARTFNGGGLETASREYKLGFMCGVRHVADKLLPLRQDVEHFERTDNVLAACSDDIVATLVNNLKVYRNTRSVLSCEGEPTYGTDCAIKALEDCLKGEKYEFRL